MPAKMQDLTGQKFNRLTVLSFAGWFGKDRRVHWSCRCDCGKDHVVAAQHLKSGQVKSCGCLLQEVEPPAPCCRLDQHYAVADLTGMVFGRLTAVICMGRTAEGRHTNWYCVCSCGNEKLVRNDHLMDGTVVSCGCKRLENLDEIAARRRAKRSRLLVGLFDAPYIRPRKGRKIKLMDG